MVSTLYKAVMLGNFFLLPAYLYAASMEEGRAAIKTGEYDKALNIFSEHAEKGNARAQRSIGKMYLDGLGVDKDANKALAWLKKATASGDAISPYFVGSLYFNGVGLAKDNNRAIKWITESAKRGYAEAQYKLGLIYELGDLAPENLTEAFGWYIKAAKQGYIVAQYQVGQMLAQGRGVTENEEEAVIWYKKARQQGYFPAAINLTLIRKQYKDTFTLYVLAANFGHPHAQKMLGLCYVEGIGTKKDMNKAIDWFEMSAIQGDTQSMLHLAIAFTEGGDIPQDFAIAYAWINLAVEHAENKDEKSKLILMKENIRTHVNGAQRIRADAIRLTTSRVMKKFATKYSGAHAWPTLPQSFQHDN